MTDKTTRIFLTMKRLLVEGIKFYEDKTEMWFSNFNPQLCEAYGMGHVLVIYEEWTYEEFDSIFKKIKDEVLQQVLEVGVEETLANINSKLSL